VPFVTRGKKFLKANRQSLLSHFADRLERLYPLTTRLVFIGHDARDGFAVTRDDQRFAFLHVVELAEKFRFCLGGLNDAHDILTS
jgi:hypothetical protein